MDKKTGLWIFAALALALAGGRSFGKASASGQGVAHQKTDVVFVGYKAALKVNAPVSEVEKYALDIKNLSIKTPGHSMQIRAQAPMQRVGDRADFLERIYGMAYPGTFVLAYWKPGEEVWYMSLLGPEQISLLRLECKPIAGGTRVTIKYELQQAKSLKYRLSEVVNIQKVMAKLIDNEIVQLQKHFDPSVNPEEILGKEKLGEFYNAFFQGEQVSVKVAAKKDKVADYLTSAKSWQSWKDQYGYDFGQCMSGNQPGPCKVSMRLLGQDIKADSFGGEFKSGNFSSAYWIAKPMAIGIGARLKAQSGGTKLTVQYMIDAPLESAAGQSDLMMTILATPQAVDDFLVNVKKEIEAEGK
jgi:hypothetical protein